IFTVLFAALALSYDLVVGHVGSLSLAHPAFFGVGAYAAAILATRARWPFLADLLAAVLAAAVVAALVGVPLFRLTEHAFAVGTLGLALVASIVANNWVEVTRGPLCITGIPKPVLGLPGGPTLAVTTLPGYYWLALAALAAVVLLYRRLTTFRLGRAFHAVRDNEPLAGAAGIDPLKSRLLAFTIRAVLFTALPEVLRLAPTWRLVIYGGLLLLVVVRSPEGIESLLRRASGARAGR